MTARVRGLAAVVILIGAIAAPAVAQDVPVVFVHGIFSSGDTWRQTAARLAATLQVDPQVVDLDSRDFLENQTAQLQGQKGGLPTHTIAIGHSQGGLISREWSKQKTLAGVLTVGTPHFGAPLSRNALDVLHFNYVLYNMFGLVSTWGHDTEVGWIVAGLVNYLNDGLQLSAGVIQRLLATVAVSGYVPVAPQLAPGSNFLFTLNHDGNLIREAGSLRHRVGLNVVAHDYWRAGIGVGLAPDQREWVWGAEVLLPPVLEWVAGYIDTYYPSKFAFAAQLRNAAGFVRDLDPLWCWAVTNDRACRIPHDGIVPTPNQYYPGAANFVLGGPAHLQETVQSEATLRNVLNAVMDVPYRNGSSGGGGGGGGGSSTAAGGTRLYPDQRWQSPNGTALLYQYDGNLVLYAPGGGPLWASGTVGVSLGYTEMQPDGNLVIYDQAGVPRWATDTFSPGATLVVHDQGYAAIVDPSGNTVWITR